jgi:hypothetical protein
MWVITTKGFYSAVQKNGDPPGTLTVRARAKQDLLNLKVEGLLPNLEIIEQAGTDYPFRIKVTSAEWARVMASLALDVDYPNFKDEVGRVQGKARASIYSSLWSILLKLEPKGLKKTWYNSALFPDEVRRALKMTAEGKSIKQIAKALGHGVTERMVRDDADLKASRKRKRGGGTQQELPTAP